MQRQIGHKRYEPIWRLMHKIRRAMGKRDDMYKLSGHIEFDEGYFKHSVPEQTQLKRGRGSQQVSNVVVMVESTPLEELDGGESSSQCRYFKMKVLSDHYKETINDVVEKTIENTSTVVSDKNPSYKGISKFVDKHIAIKSDKTVTKTDLKWVHIAISNAKRNLLGVYHMVSQKYLQSYLDEFCYKLNRRNFGERLFNRTIIAIIG